MPLPTISTPTYELTLPSSGKKIKYRPFLVREEKVLIMALESEDTKQITNSVIDILNSCILSKGIKLETLATFDIEYVFLQIRTKSVGETVNVQITCPDDNETTVEAEIPLDDIKVKKTRGHKPEIKLDDSVIVKMKYPSLDTFVEMNFSEDQGVEQVFKMAASCIESISDAEQVYDASDSTKEELNEFFESLTSSQFKLIQEFFETMPKLAYTLKVTNPNTGVESDVELEGLASFSA